MSYSDRRFVPGHWVGSGQFQHYERPHWALLSGGWASAPPPAGGVTGGFQQVHPDVNAGYVQVPHPQKMLGGIPTPRATGHMVAPRGELRPIDRGGWGHSPFNPAQQPPSQPIDSWQVPIILRLLGIG